MKKSLAILVAEMKQLESKLTSGIGCWEDYSGYEINAELSQFIDLTEELEYA